mmetsp:Transcript_45352/g.151261  ORF Transcript_45352/g.151261 Transcript_45352/m.151261 type:complete len:380 (+) Transcript_45352:71-1210(+)
MPITDNQKVLADQVSALAKRANEAGAVASAAVLFEAAHALSNNWTSRVSAANMRLKLGDVAAACAAYESMLCDNGGSAMPDRIRQLAERKREEALSALAEAERGQSSRASFWATLGGEGGGGIAARTTTVAQRRIEARWRESEPAAAPATAEALKVAGNARNQAGDAAVAKLLYSAAYALSGRLELRLSAANMELKEGGPAHAAAALDEYDRIAAEAEAVGRPLTQAHTSLLARKRAEAAAQIRPAAAAEASAVDVSATDAAAADAIAAVDAAAADAAAAAAPADDPATAAVAADAAAAAAADAATALQTMRLRRYSTAGSSVDWGEQEERAEEQAARVEMAGRASLGEEAPAPVSPVESKTRRAERRDLLRQKRDGRD